MDRRAKRPAEGHGRDGNDKRQKTKKQWKVPRKGEENNHHTSHIISPGDSGIWATCNRGKERACVGELRDLFNEYAELLYGGGGGSGEDVAAADEAADKASVDIEKEINDEVAEMRHPASAQLFTPMRVDVQCVVFFKTVAPVEPVSLVKRICEDAMSKAHRKRTRWVKRLSPMTLIDRATTQGLEKVAMIVLEPHFHREPFHPRKFAIRPTSRNHNTITRDQTIKLVAQCVGKGHEVDLKNYDLLIIVEIFQNICGVSVVDSSFERLKRFNLAEIFDPTVHDAETLAAAPNPAHQDDDRAEAAGTPPPHAADEALPSAVEGS